MARRAALIALAFGLISCGSSGGGSWSCTWRCNSTNTGGSATYPAATSNPTEQCTADHGAGCSDFSCNCNQG